MSCGEDRRAMYINSQSGEKRAERREQKLRTQIQSTQTAPSHRQQPALVSLPFLKSLDSHRSYSSHSSYSTKNIFPLQKPTKSESIVDYQRSSGESMVAPKRILDES